MLTRRAVTRLDAARERRQDRGRRRLGRLAVLTYNLMVVGTVGTERRTRSFMRWPIARAATSSRVVLQDAHSVSELARRYPISFAAVHKHVGRSSARDWSPRPVTAASSGCVATSRRCGARIACWTISRRYGAGGSSASSGSSRIRHKEARDDRDRASSRTQRPGPWPSSRVLTRRSVGSGGSGAIRVSSSAGGGRRGIPRR